MLSDGSVDAKGHGLRFAPQISNTQRPPLRSIRTLETYAMSLMMSSPDVNRISIAVSAAST